jgi:hypothetical protein
MDSGRGLFIEGSDFGYAMSSTELYSYFGCNYVGDGNSTYFNVEYLEGIQKTLAEGILIDYMHGTGPDWSVDIIDSNGGTLFFLSQDQNGRAISYEGEADTYRAIHQCHLFGAMIDGEHTKAEVMERYLDYLYRPVKVNLSPHSTILRRGDSAAVDVTIESNTGTALNAYGMVSIVLPNTYMYMYVPPRAFHLEPGETLTCTARHVIPENAPLGDYRYMVVIGDSNRTVYDRDGFSFEIVP